MCEMVNHDLRQWVRELVRFAHQACPEVAPSPLGSVFETPPVTAVDRTPDWLSAWEKGEF